MAKCPGEPAASSFAIFRDTKTSLEGHKWALHRQSMRGRYKPLGPPQIPQMRWEGKHLKQTIQLDECLPPERQRLREFSSPVRPDPKVPSPRIKDGRTKENGFFSMCFIMFLCLTPSCRSFSFILFLKAQGSLQEA